MKTNTIKKILREKGIVMPDCLTWQVNDLDKAFKETGQAHHLKGMTQENKVELLDDFFSEHEDQIVEFINELMNNHFDGITDYQDIH